MLAVLRVRATEENAADVSFALSNSYTSSALAGILQECVSHWIARRWTSVEHGRSKT